MRILLRGLFGEDSSLLIKREGQEIHSGVKKVSVHGEAEGPGLALSRGSVSTRLMYKV